MSSYLNRLTVILLSVLCGTSAVAETVQDLRYGVTLYYFYQQDYFNALTELMAAEETQSLPHHADQASLLKGGINLSYGLDRAAEASFQQWLTVPSEAEFETSSEQTTAVQQHQRAWFYLGKLNYQRGDDTRAMTALQQVTATANHSSTDLALQQESLYLQAKLQLQQGDMQAAASTAAKLPQESIYLPYYWFNRGSQLAINGDWSAAAETYKQLGQLPLVTETEKTLRDRALTAAGFAHLHEQKIDEAIEVFNRVRLNSPMVDRALLGLGWAQLQAERFEQALAPWQQLRAQSLLQPSVQEVYLALPYAYEQLGASAAALREYEFAREAFNTEVQQLTKAVQTYQQQPLNILFSFDLNVDSDWLLPEAISPASDDVPYLPHLFASHEFQLAVKDYRDLISLQHYLSRASERLAVLKIVDTEQQQLWQRMIDGDELQQLRQRFEQLTLLSETLDQRITAASEDSSGQLLADERSLELWELIERSEKLLVDLQAVEQAGDFEREQLRLLHGLLLWESSEQYPIALWQLKKLRRQIADKLTETQQQLETVKTIVAQRSTSLFLTRIEQLAETTEQQKNLVDKQLMQQTDFIRQLAVTELEGQQQKLRFYLGKAKLSIARLYDESSEETAQ